jgi:CheY-like chemotaxis protein/uncharacterized membrane protein YtjA (UPF0391 family)
VRLSQVDGHVELAVIDTGEGFPNELRTVIFDRFRQSRTPLTRRHGGLGLGLAIVRHLVEEHGGTVNAESPGPGKGATFTIRLPLADIQVPARASIAQSDEATIDLRGVSIMLVEDDTDWREAIALRLGQAGAEVTAAGTVAEALALLEETRPQVLVSDIGMPEADGYALIREVRSRLGAPVRAVAMTGFADPESRERCLQGGFDAFLPKPFEPGWLLVTVGAHLAPARKPRAVFAAERHETSTRAAVSFSKSESPCARKGQFFRSLDWHTRCSPSHPEDASMLNMAIAFFVIAIIAALLGFGGVAGMSAHIGWLLAVLGVVVLAIGLLGRAIGGGRNALP